MLFQSVPRRFGRGKHSKAAEDSRSPKRKR
jgi:hypothetical protein